MLSHVKINNFKTYRGEYVVGPLRTSTVVRGRNGSGKSNFTDALCFVMGTGLDVLRASNFVQLIHGGNSSRPISDTASVTAVFILEDGTKKEFTRIIKIQGHSSSAILLYLIDNKEVDEKKYLDELQSSGLCVNFENFFVFQGNVEHFIRMKPKHFTSVIEDLSGSGTLRIKYDNLQRKMRKLEDQHHQLALQRKSLMAEIVKKKAEMLVYEEYHNLIQELEKTQVDEKLFLLFDNERNVTRCEEKCRKIEDSLGNLKQQKVRKLEELQRKDLRKLRLQISKTTSDLHKMETECQEKCQTLKRKEETMENLAHKIKLVSDSLVRERKLDEKQKSVILQLKKDLASVQEQITQHENLIQSQETDEAMEEERVKQYDKLKQETGKQTAALRQQLYVAQKEQKDLQELLEREKCTKLQISHQNEGITKAIADSNTRLQKIDSYIKEKELNLSEKKKLQDKIQAEVRNADKEIEEVKNELENVVKLLDEMSIRSELLLKEKMKQDIVKDLKMRFGDNIVGRMSDLCQPVHERYKLAITKVMGKNLHALVVKNKVTALEVIDHLKMFRAPPEVILPLDTIKVYPIQEKLRNLRTSSGEQVRLLFDVIHCKNQIIEPAVQFAVSNCLVCDTTDTARHVAYELEPKVQYNVVSLDGTYYQKGGVVSSGEVSLQKKAKCWMAEEFLQAKNRKVDLHEKLRDLQKQSKMVTGTGKISDEICSLEAHLKYAQKDKNRVVDKVAEFQLQLQKVNTQSAAVDSRVARLQPEEQDHCNKIHTITNKINIVEDGIFADFCHKIGVTSIREYEGIGLRIYQERAEKRNELSAHKQNILMQLEYEQKKLGASNRISKKEQELRELKTQLETAKRNVQEAEEEKTSHTQKYKDLKLNLQSLKQKVFSAEKAKDDVKRLTEDIKEGSSKLSSKKLKIEDLKYTRHNLLVQCKVHGLNVPMSYGTMAYIHESQSEAAEQDERRIVLDYSQLSDSLKEASDTEKALQELRSKVEEIMFKIRTKEPNMKVGEEFNALQSSLKEVCSETASALQILRHDGNRFKQMREDRTCRFMECFNSLETEVDSIYKDLYETLTGEATLTLENPDEPYLAGVRYSVRVPGKKCVVMDCLSGGEAAMASLAFLFALIRYKKMPFIILDEPDGSLDHRNVSRFTKFLKQYNNLQIIIITHCHRRAYAVLADDVIGVARENENESAVSNLSLLDLTVY